MNPSQYQILNAFQKAGFKNSHNLIHYFAGGSHQHGARVDGKSDIDLCGVYIEEPHRVLGVSLEEHFTSSTQDQYEKNSSEDTDYKAYTLRRWAGLACKGNPTVIGYLFMPPTRTTTDVWFEHIVPNSHLFKATFHAGAFLGYADAQCKRLQGLKGHGKHGQRPELEKEFGYDVKAGMHLIRLMYECEEYMRTGVITYPRPEKDLLIDIRQGEWTLEKLLREYNDLELRAKEAKASSELPTNIDREAISKVIAGAYIEHWNKTGLLKEYGKDY